MIGIISGFLLILLALLVLALQRLYSSIPARELKRLARRGDHLAKVLYRPVAYGASLRLLLWLVLGAAMSAGFLIVIPHLPAIASFLLFSVVLVVAFVWLPTLRLTVHSAQLAAALAPAVAWVLSYIHSPLDKLAKLINRYRELTPHSRLYEKEDLANLLAIQKNQVDNRIVQQELELAERALAFDDKQATAIMQSRKQVHLVNADDTIGPVLLDQLHQSRQGSFLVYKGKKENIVGSLAMRDAVNAKQGGRVFDLIRSDLAYVREDFTLRQVLAGFQKTGLHVAVVVNNFEEFLGIITLDNLLKELLGETQADEGANYENRQAIANYQPKKEPETAGGQPEAPDEEVASPETTEVVE